MLLPNLAQMFLSRFFIGAFSSLSLRSHCLFNVYIFVLPPETLLFEDNTAF